MIKILKKILLFQFFFSALNTDAQTAFKNIAFSSLDIKDGLSSYTVRKILQDQYGFIWIATKDGLNRYDGKTFKILNKGLIGSEKILGNDFWDICEDTVRNLIWAATAYGGLNAIDTKNSSIKFNVPAIVDSDNFSNGWLRCLNICRGKIWIGTDNGLNIFDPETKSFIKYEKIPFQKNERVQNYSVDILFVDQFNRIWVFIKNLGLVIYSGTNYTILQVHQISEFDLPYIGDDKKIFNDALLIDSSSLLLSTHQGIRILTYNAYGVQKIRNRDILLNKTLSAENIISSGKEKGNDFWFVTPNHIYTYSFIRNSLFQIQPIINGTKVHFSSLISTIFIDKENYLWLGTDKEIFFSGNTQLKFLPVYQSTDNKFKINSTYFLYPITDSSIYACGEYGLYFINNGNFSIIDSSKKYWYIHSISKSTFFASTNAGCFILDTPKNIKFAEKQFPELKILRSVVINSGANVGDSIWVLGAEYGQGIYLWNYKNHTIENINTETKPLYLKNNNINNIYKSHNGNLWIICDNSIGIFDPQKHTIKSLTWIDSLYKQPYSVFFDVAEVDGYYWATVYGTGILKIDTNYRICKVISGKEGMPTTGVFTLTPINDSLLFTTSNNGLYFLNVKTLAARTFFETDGLSSSNNWVSSKKNELIYIGGDKGFTIIKPNFLDINKNPPTLYINNIKLETAIKSIDTSELSFNKYTVPSNFLQINVFFSGLNFSNPARTSYAYRIKEIDKDWIDLGTQNFITLIGLSPGTYTLEVKAANEDGVWCEPKTLMLTFEPKWYQTWQFDLLVGLAVASLLYGFYRYRLMQIRKQHQIRKEIAGDLHDDIGATLNGVKIFAHLAETSKDNKKYFVNIKEALTHASTGLRDMIWVLDDSGDTISDLVKRLKMFAQPVTEASEISIRFTEDPSANNITLNKTEKRNLLLIAKEAINNSIKYAECENIQVTFFRLQNKTAVKIEDDGKGFNQDEIIRGNGLNNMQQRAHQIHYRIKLESEVGKGTKITVVKK